MRREKRAAARGLVCSPPSRGWSRGRVVHSAATAGEAADRWKAGSRGGGGRENEVVVVVGLWSLEAGDPWGGGG